MSDAVSASSHFARWTSILLHPFAVFAALALIAAWRMDPASLPRTAIGMAVAVAIVWAFVLQRRRSGRWGTVDASDRRERPVLYALVLVVDLILISFADVFPKDQRHAALILLKAKL